MPEDFGNIAEGVSESTEAFKSFKISGAEALTSTIGLVQSLTSSIQNMLTNPAGGATAFAGFGALIKRFIADPMANAKIKTGEWNAEMVKSYATLTKVAMGMNVVAGASVGFAAKLGLVREELEDTTVDMMKFMRTTPNISVAQKDAEILMRTRANIASTYNEQFAKSYQKTFESMWSFLESGNNKFGKNIRPKIIETMTGLTAVTGFDYGSAIKNLSTQYASYGINAANAFDATERIREGFYQSSMAIGDMADNLDVVMKLTNQWVGAGNSPKVAMMQAGGFVSSMAAAGAGAPQISMLGQLVTGVMGGSNVGGRAGMHGLGTELGVKGIAGTNVAAFSKQLMNANPVDIMKMMQDVTKAAHTQYGPEFGAVMIERKLRMNNDMQRLVMSLDLNEKAMKALRDLTWDDAQKKFKITEDFKRQYPKQYEVLKTLGTWQEQVGNKLKEGIQNLELGTPSAKGIFGATGGALGLGALGLMLSKFGGGKGKMLGALLAGGSASSLGGGDMGDVIGTAVNAGILAKLVGGGAATGVSAGMLAKFGVGAAKEIATGTPYSLFQKAAMSRAASVSPMGIFKNILGKASLPLAVISTAYTAYQLGEMDKQDRLEQNRQRMYRSIGLNSEGKIEGLESDQAKIEEWDRTSKFFPGIPEPADVTAARQNFSSYYKSSGNSFFDKTGTRPPIGTALSLVGKPTTSERSYKNTTSANGGNDVAGGSGAKTSITINFVSSNGVTSQTYETANDATFTFSSHLLSAGGIG